MGFSRVGDIIRATQGRMDAWEGRAVKSLSAIAKYKAFSFFHGFLSRPIMELFKFTI